MSFWRLGCLFSLSLSGVSWGLAEEAPRGALKIGEAPNSVRELRRLIREIRRDHTVMRPRADGRGVQRHAPGTGYLESYLFRLQQRAYPNDSIDWTAYDRALAHRARMPRAYPTAGPEAQASPRLNRWEFIGPTNLGVPYRTYWGQPPVSGRINAIAVDPQDPNTIYLGGPVGGLWRSRDGGTNWQPLTDDWPYLAVSSIAIDPTNPDVIMVGTGDFPGWGGYAFGLMISEDGGQNWTNTGRAEFGNFAVSHIEIDPDNPQNVYATVGRGRSFWGRVWRSQDGGYSWTRTLDRSAPWADIDFGARRDGGGRRLYAAGGAQDGQVWRSDDRGATWTRLSPPITGVYHDSIAIAASPTQPDTVYLLTPQMQKLWKSVDAGVTWTDATTGWLSSGPSYNWAQGWYDWHLHTAPAAGGEDAVFVGLIDIAMSRDSARSFESIGGPTFSDVAITHNDQHSFAVDPSNPSRVYVGNDGGIYRVDVNYTTGAFAYTNLNKTMGVTQFYTGTWHPSDPDVMLGGTQDNATPYAAGDLANWRNVGGGDGGGVALNPQNPRVMFTTSQFYGKSERGDIFLYRTDNGWASTSYPSTNVGTDNVAFIPPLAIDPNQPQHVYAGTNFLYRYNDQTRRWTNRVGNTMLTGAANQVILTMTVAPNNSNFIYTGSSDGRVFASNDFGVTWRAIQSGSPGLPNRSITSIDVNPRNPADILVSVSGTGSGHLYRLRDAFAATRAWENLSGSGATGLPDIPTSTVARHASDPERWLFVGTDIGVFMTRNGGQTWVNYTTSMGLPNTIVTKLQFVPRTGFLNAATFGRGMWRIRLPQIGFPAN